MFHFLVVIVYLLLMVLHGFPVGGIGIFLVLLPFFIQVMRLEFLQRQLRVPRSVLGVVQFCTAFVDGLLQCHGCFFHGLFPGGQGLSFRCDFMLVIPNGESGSQYSQQEKYVAHVNVPMIRVKLQK